ncbi:MAG: hypothetical protein KAJ19_08415 [Gammaproteobacteria bacterium]|nr:hypothetical protein [Gammaproteobacteria bacterium]
MSLLDDVKAQLEADAVTGGGTGWACYLSMSPENVSDVIILLETGGLETDQTEGAKVDPITFQAIVQGTVRGYEAARTKWTELFNSLNNVDIAGYVYMYANQAGPIPMGYDQNDRPLLSANFTCLKNR